MRVARVQKCCEIAEGLTLRNWHGGWWLWRRSHWVEIHERSMRRMLYGFTEHALYVSDDGVPKPWLPNRRKLGDLMEALGAVVGLSDEFEQPCWIDGREANGTIVSTANGLLDIETEDFYDHTPKYFNQTAVPFDYNPRASKPAKWHGFLGELWPSPPGVEADAIKVLGEWFGYVLSGRTYLHKIFFTVGPTRGGKGIIGRILSALLGRRNVCGPTLSSWGTNFGLAPLIGKPLAVISDARFSGKNGGDVVERMLAISGEDTLTIDIKYREQWSGKLPTRLHIISNELPKLGDASTAIVGRIVLLPLTRSWLGKEDLELEPALFAELPGILNWALKGLQRLTIENENKFTFLPAAEEAITAMRDLASPVAAFVRECCVRKPNASIAVDDLYKAYKDWADENEHPRKEKQTFGRDLRAAAPEVTVSRPGDAERVRTYRGIALTGEKEERLV